MTYNPDIAGDIAVMTVTGCGIIGTTVGSYYGAQEYTINTYQNHTYLFFAKNKTR